MAVRKHNGKEYPVPGIDTAIKIIRPTAKWSITDDEFDGWEDEAGTDPPTCLLYTSPSPRD